MKVLEIGTGSGFNAALLAEGTGDPRLVYSIDLQEDLVAEARQHLDESGYAGVNLRCGDGGYGWKDAGPFDRIIVTAGSADIPPAWLDQLAEGGVLLAPFTTPPLGDLQLRLRKERGGVAGEFLDVFFFMNLQGAYHVAPMAPAGGSGVRDAKLQAVLRTAPGYSCGMSWAERASFWLFSRGQLEWFAKVVESWHKVGSHWQAAMADPAAGLYVVYDELGMLKAYGRLGPVWNFGALVERWKAHGWPKITDYAVRVEADRASSPGPGEWIDRRPNVTLRIRVREVEAVG